MTPGDPPSPVDEAPPGIPFGDRLARAVADRASQVVLGIDPDPNRLWPESDGRAPELALLAADAAALIASGRVGADGAAAEEIAPTGAQSGAAVNVTVPSSAQSSAAASALGQTAIAPISAAQVQAAGAVLGQSRALIDAAGLACVAIKPQFACFERLGYPGWIALAATIRYARERGLLVIGDAKRGDIGTTATAYAQAFFAGVQTRFGRAPGLALDAVTLNPLLGRDAFAPLLDGAARSGAGAFLLVRTSNPGAADIFDLELKDGGALWERIAGFVAAAGEPGPLSGIASVGAVVGATAPKHLDRMRELMPHTPFLLPGIGAQGGSIDALAAAVAPGRAGALITASRSIAHAYETYGSDPATAARGEAERLREQAWALT